MKLFCGFFFVTLVWCTIATSVIPWPPKAIIINQRKNHFSETSDNFKQLTLYEDKHWNQKGPILFYCGHERSINILWNNTGFIFEYARDVEGFVIFAEHRYYGKSMPFGKNSLQGNNSLYLSIAQALKDYVNVLTNYRARFNVSADIPVIAFGGGYGGILAGLMRSNFPELVEGALISSAPFMWLAGRGHFHDMLTSITKVYEEINPVCSKIIKKAFIKITDSRHNDLKTISKIMKLCRNLTSANDAMHLMQWSRNAFIIMAMMNYPYSSNFLHELPPSPFNISCKRVSMHDESTAIEALRDAVDVYYNSTGKLECFSIFKEYQPCADIKGCGNGLNSAAFDYQSCTEMPLYDSILYENTSMFPGIMPSFLSLSKHCLKKWLIQPEISIFSRSYTDSDFSDASNMIFSNGYLDPWQLGGVLQNISRTVVAFNIFGGAYHYDLRESNDNDSLSVIDVRRAERLVMKKWIKNFNSKK